MRLPKTPLFTTAFHDGAYVPSYITNAVIHDPTHVLRPLVQSHLDSWPRRGLWVRVTSFGFSSKATVRRWVNRRVEEALRQELKMRGVGLNGIDLQGYSRPERIKGTLELYVKKEAVTAKWPDLRLDTAKVAHALLSPAGLSKG